MLTNTGVHFEIALDAHTEMEALLRARRAPNPHVPNGSIVAFDGSQSAHKKALICIAFSAAFLESFTYLRALKTSRRWAEKIGHMGYRDRLSALGVEDGELLDASARFQKARNDLMHERAVALSRIDSATLRSSRDCAGLAIFVISSARKTLSE